MQINKDEIRKGKRVMDTVTGNIGVLADIQEAHDRYQLTNVSGWQYGIKNLIPYDAKDETIRQQAAEIERLREDSDKWEKEARLQYRLHNEMIDEARGLRERLQHSEEARKALRECLEWYADTFIYEYETSYLDQDAPILDDCGERARTLLAELNRKDTQPTRPRFPRQPNGGGDWTIEFDYLERLREATERMDDVPPALEQIEMVLLAVEELDRKDTQPKEGGQ